MKKYVYMIARHVLINISNYQIKIKILFYIYPEKPHSFLVFYVIFNGYIWTEKLADSSCLLNICLEE